MINAKQHKILNLDVPLLSLQKQPSTSTPLFTLISTSSSTLSSLPI